MNHTTRIVLLSFTGAALIAGAFAWAQMTPNDPRDVHSVIISEHDTLRLRLPDTVVTGVPFDVSFSTFGGGCVQKAARTAVTLSPGTAVIQPYDRHSGAVSCPRTRFALAHSARVRFDVPGRNVIRIAADARDSTARQGTVNAEVVKTVVVCDCRPADPAPTTRRRGSPADSVRGISFIIDTATFDANAIPPGPDAIHAWSTFASIRARVAVAGSRGRMDILWTRPGPSLLVDSIVLAAPLGRAGDYYLFDSTEFVLVRPRAKTYTRYAISGDNYNHAGRRDGWPDYFDFSPVHVDTVVPSAPALPPTSKPVQVFWHSDMLPNVAIARGSLTMDDAPMSEMNVARWFGAARDLAHASLFNALPTTRTTVTAAILWKPGAKPGVPSTFILKAELVQLHAAMVPVGSLRLPATFHEVAPRD